MHNVILVANAGSSSLKISIFIIKDNKIKGRTYLAFLEKKGDEIIFHITDQEKTHQLSATKIQGDPLDLMIKIFYEWWDDQTNLNLIATGHRVVHGGADFSAPVIVTEEVDEKLKSLIPLNPLHQPYNLQVINLFKQKYPTISHIACFDTAFHVSQSKLAKSFGLPQEFYDQGIYRYGFHGLSYTWITDNFEKLTQQTLPKRTIIAHLGSGSSMCAVKNGKSVATSMGFSVLDGLIMGTRVGAIDPGVILYFLEHKKMSVSEITDLLYRRSGLLGLSGESADVRILLGSKSKDAKFAIDLFIYRVQLEIGRLAAALEGLDCLIFTGGIGQNSSKIRQAITMNLGWLGVELDNKANIANHSLINANNSKIKIFALPTNEEGVIAREVVKFL